MKRLFFSFYGQVILWTMMFVLKLMLFYSMTEYTLSVESFTSAVAVYIGGLIAVNGGGVFRIGRTAIWAFIWGVMLLVNAIHLQVFHDFFSISILKQAIYAEEIGGSVLALLKWTHLAFFLDLLIIPIVWRMGHAIDENQPTVKRSWRWLSGKKMIWAQIIVLGWIAFVWPFFRADGLWHLLKIRYSNPFILHQLGLPGYVIYDFAYGLNQALTDKELEPEDLKAINAFFEQRKKEREHSAAPFRGKNLILLQAESVQQFVIGRTINGQAVTPNLNQLALKGLYFNRIYDQTASGRTTDAEMAALRSVFPSRMNGSIYVNFPQNQYLSLPRLMREAGYYTLSAHAFSASFYKRNLAHPAQGFEESLFEHDFRMSERIGWGLSDASFYRQVVERIEQLPKPFFSFLISLSNHTPYQAVKDERIQLKLPDDWADSKQGGYLQSVHYTDWAIGQLVEALRARGMLEDTVLVIYGDHDAAFSPEELEWFAENNEDTRELDRVPLIIYSEAKGSTTEGKVHAVNGGQLDIAPTLLELFGVDSRNARFFGSSLVSGDSMRNVVFRDGSYRSPEKFVDCNQMKTDYCNTAQDMLRLSDLMLESNADQIGLETKSNVRK